MKCVRESEILVEQQPPQRVLVCDHAGRVINKLSLAEAVSEQAASNKRPLPSVSRGEDRPAKARRLDHDELELLHSSAGAAAVYELIGGRFVEAHAPSMLPAEEAPCVFGVGVGFVAQPRPDFDELFLSKEGWLAWAESLGSADS